MPLTIFVALFWTLSNNQQSFSYVGDHACTQYSRYGLTYAQYSLVITSPLLYETFLFITPSILRAFFLAVVTCSDADSLVFTFTPKSFSFSICTNLCPPISYAVSYLALPMCITLHLLKLNFICHVSDHSTSLSRSAWRTSWSCFPSIILKTFRSSANFKTVLFTSSSIEFMNIKNSKGPRTDPCGTPLSTSFHPDLVPFRRTLCWRPESQFSIQCNILVLIPCHFSCKHNLLWGTLSNALLKSRYETSSCLPLSKLSVALSKNYNRLVKHERPLLKPCWVSLIISFSSRKSTILSLRIDSIVLHTKDVRLTGL